MRPRLTYANVMATVAVFLALGGGALAASNLGKNTVGAKQLKKNAVTTAKIKNTAVTGAKIKPGTITGTQINVATLGTVPSATHAASADSIPQAEPIHVVGAPGQPVFEHGATNSPGLLGLAFPAVGFYKDAFGVVHLEGVVGMAGAPGVAFTLPPGYRPPSGNIQVFEQVKEAGVFIFGSADGAVPAGAVLATKPTAYLSGITYRAGS